MDNSIVVQDCRLITINSQDAYVKNNGDNNSDLIFSFSGLLTDSPDVLYTTVSVIDAQIPVAWYLINDLTNVLNFEIHNSISGAVQSYQLLLDYGNYSGSNITTQLQKQFDLALSAVVESCIVQFDIITGRLTFQFSGLKPEESVVFIHTGSEGLFRILGFNVELDYVSVNSGAYKYVYPNKPLNCLGIKSIRVVSNHLATVNSMDSSSSKNVICSIPVDVPAWGLVCYKNTLPYFSRLKSRVVNTIDIKLYDEFQRLLELNATNFTMTIQMVIYRKVVATTETLDMLKQIDTDIQNLQTPPQQPPPPQQQDTLAPVSDLDILQYQNVGF